MSEQKNKPELLNENELDAVVGGAAGNFMAALDVINGKYGNGEERVKQLAAAGYDYAAVQTLVNGLAKGYGKVAREVINGDYGNGEARVAALKNAGYDAKLVQDIVNGMLIN